MKRFPLVLAGTAAGLVAVVGFHPAAPSSQVLASGTSKAGSTGKSPTTSQGTSPPPAGSTTSPSSGKSTSPTSSTATTAPGTTPTTAPATTSAARSSTGPAEQYGYGSLRVKVTVTGNKITKVGVPNLQTADQYSQQLATQVIPMLTSEVLKAQSTNINGISGASYTAEAYVTSLQAALKNLHFK